MSKSPESPWFSFSLRMLFAATTILAVGFAALKFVGVWAIVLYAVVMLLLTAMAIVAVVDRGSRQAFAIGFIVAALGYLGVAFLSDGFSIQQAPFSSNHPSAWLMQPVFEWIVERRWIDNTGKVIPNYTPSAQGTRSVFPLQQEWPDRLNFMRTSHVLLSLIVGFLGGIFARYIYARRQRVD